MSYAASAQQYAALPWRQAPGLEILLITSRETRRWVIPKGWPMPGKSAAQEAYERTRQWQMQLRSLQRADHKGSPMPQ